MSSRSNEHTHNLSEGQLICNNEQCRKQALHQIQETNNKLKNNFDKIVERNSQDNKINIHQGWTILYLASKTLSDRLMNLFNKEEIHQIIDNYIERDNTKYAFEKAFAHEQKPNEMITKDQLWKIYINMCEDAVRVLSKAKKERGKHVANFLMFDENEL